MPARRCSTCGISYPPTRQSACGACQQPLDYLSDREYDRDWRTKMELARPVPDELESRKQQVLAWRMGTLLQAGYELEHAEALASRTHDIDLHYAVELVSVRGCPPALAARVLL